MRQYERHTQKKHEFFESFSNVDFSKARIKMFEERV
jgi:hypothetical protein